MVNNTNLLFINLGKELGLLDNLKAKIEDRLNGATTERPLTSFEIGVVNYQLNTQYEAVLKIIKELGIEDKVNLVEYTDYLNTLELLYNKFSKKEEYVILDAQK